MGMIRIIWAYVFLVALDVKQCEPTLNLRKVHRNTENKLSV